MWFIMLGNITLIHQINLIICFFSVTSWCIIHVCETAIVMALFTYTQLDQVEFDFIHVVLGHGKSHDMCE